MTTIEGIWYDGVTSRGRRAQLRCDAATVSVATAGQTLTPPTPRSAVTISQRLGNTPRQVRFPDGGLFETDAHDAVDQWLAPHPSHGWIHRLESHWRAVALAIVVVVLVVAAAVRYGVPLAARVIADAVPVQMGGQMDQQLITLLDHEYFAASRLDVATQERLRARFREFLPRSAQGVELTVLFRSAAQSLGPNALALPGGTILFTDELVQLAENDEQLVAVYAHEVGHVSRRHALRQTLQASLLSLLVLSVSGDLSSVSSLITTLPVTLTQLGYSRDFEREADGDAVAALRARQIDPVHFARALERLEAWHHCDLPRDSGAPPCEARDGDNRFASYLSTHPATTERIAFVRGQR